MEDEIEYYGRREAEERQAAERALSPEAAERHRALADQYAQRIQKGLSAAR